MADDTHKIIHAFGALADLGQAVADKNDFQETVRTSLHLISGAIGIMRGGVARYSRFSHELTLAAARGLGDDFPLCLNIGADDEKQFLINGLYPLEIDQAKTLPFFQRYGSSFDARNITLFVPLVIRDELLGALFLGEKALDLFAQRNVLGSDIDRLPAGVEGLDVHRHILNTPNVVGSIGAFRLAEMLRPSTRRVCEGSMTPSSHNRALA